MSKILFLVNHDVVIYNFRLELVERLLAEGHEVVISSPYGERIEDLKKLGCEYRKINIARHGTNPIKEFRLVLEYIRLLKAVNPDVVLTYTIKPNIYGSIACRMKKIPCMVNITGLGTAIKNGGIMQKVLTALYKYALKKVSFVFYQNEAIMQFFTENKITTAPSQLLPGSGVNLKKYMVLDYPEDSGTTKFLFIGRIMKDKGIDEYLESAKYIKSKHSNVEFHIIGFSEPEYENVLNEIVSGNIVKYHGMVKNVIPYLQASHCTILPSYHEGMANVLLESAACGRPVIATNVPGCRETFEDGVSGFACEAKSALSLTEAIEKFIVLPYEEKKNMGIAGRNKVEKEFNRQIVINAYLNELNKIK